MPFPLYWRSLCTTQLLHQISIGGAPSKLTERGMGMPPMGTIGANGIKFHSLYIFTTAGTGDDGTLAFFFNEASEGGFVYIWVYLLFFGLF